MNTIPAPNPPNWANVIAQSFGFLAARGGFVVEALSSGGAVELHGFADSSLISSNKLTLTGLPVEITGATGVTVQVTNVPAMLQLLSGLTQLLLPSNGPAQLQSAFGVEIKALSGSGGVTVSTTASPIELQTGNADIAIAAGGGWGVVLG